ncbi:MAG: hypothetical protein CMJ42_13460 [Phyllobacteriaceae bacterium]|nr:hypothetical protein [Phyllobacteriaceae bacterium]MBA89601.1 hypothetical protein [Phyllobacteriaceae bacterium]
MNQERKRADESAARLRADTADMLEVLARLFEDGRFATAAAHLRGKRPGRRQVDDGRALAFARGLLATGFARSPHDACRRAAILFAPSHQVETMRDRLRKKIGRN